MMMSVIIATLLEVSPDRHDLSGRILDDTGNSITGARVLIYTSATRVGVNPFCLSCYADCAKSADTENDVRRPLE